MSTESGGKLISMIFRGRRSSRYMYTQLQKRHQSILKYIEIKLILPSFASSALKIIVYLETPPPIIFCYFILTGHLQHALNFKWGRGKTPFKLTKSCPVFMSYEVIDTYRISHDLWCDMIFIQLVCDFISHHQAWEILFIKYSPLCILYSLDFLA
jgi:hypothetical protein